MMELLLGFLHVYAMLGFFVAIMFPMMREEFSDQRFFFRKHGETGAELIGKTRVREIREYVSDRVWQDLVTNVVFLGGPSTGKTTLAKAMSHFWDERWQPEVGREFWEEHADENGKLTTQQLYALAKAHIEEEDTALTEARNYLFTDTNAITTGLFSKWYHGEIDGRLQRLMLRNAQRYDVFILCDDDIPFEPEEGRGGPEGRKRLQRMHESWLDAHGVPYYRVSGDVAERVNQVSEILESFNKWDHEQ